MAIILDSDEWADKGYMQYLEKAWFTALAKAMPAQKFIYRRQATMPIVPENMEAVSFPPSSGLFVQKKTDRWLADCGADLFISFKKTLTTSAAVKQVLLLSSETAFTNLKSIDRADRLGFTSAWLQQGFLTKYPSLASKCFVADGFAAAADVLKNVDDQKVKSELTEGWEYFINADFWLDRERFVTLLKGFSAFKRRLQSGWKLVVALRSNGGITTAEADALLANYKYRADVVLTNSMQLAEKINSAYALISLDQQELFPMAVAEAVGLCTPAIAATTQTAKSIFGDALVYAEKCSSDIIGEKMMLLYKTESIKMKLTEQMKTGHFYNPFNETVATLLSMLS